MERIGLYGGTFDPVHLGHLLVARAAVEEMGLSRLYFIPAARSPFKPSGEATTGHERVRLLRLALAGMTDCEVDEQELVQGGVSYTIDTIRRYAAQHPHLELHYVVGADHVVSLPKWRDAEELARTVQFIVAPRPNADPVIIPPPFRGTKLQGIPVAISASLVRQRVKAGRPIELLTGPFVAEAIAKNRLYL